MKLKVFFTSISIFLLSSFILVSPGFSRTFKEDQLRYERVRTAVKQNESNLKKLFADQGLKYPPVQIFIRVFKQEKIVELWAFSKKDDKFRKVTSYPICSSSGKLGPKRRSGDFQVPEGFYHVNRFNPASRFYLSLGINYPNASDRILGVTGKLGGDIFIHGNCVTIGCVPITDDLIKELYLAAVEAKSNGQRNIPVHIFPARLNDGGMKKLREIYSERSELISFWESLKPAYDFFENNRNIPGIQVNNKGAYEVRSSVNAAGNLWKELDKGLELAYFKVPLKIYSIAAVATDKSGNVLFIHSRAPFSVYDFNRMLLTLPLDIQNAMYKESKELKPTSRCFKDYISSLKKNRKL